MENPLGLPNAFAKKEKALVGEPCDKPQEVCLAVAKIPGIIEQFDHWGRPITKEEAYNILKKSRRICASPFNI